MGTDRRNRYDAHFIREVCVRGLVDPATVRRFLDGKPVRDLSRRRIAKAIDEMELDEITLPAGARVRGRGR